MTDEDIDAILSRGETRTAELSERLQKLGSDDLQDFTFDTSGTYVGQGLQVASGNGCQGFWAMCAYRAPSSTRPPLLPNIVY